MKKNDMADKLHDLADKCGEFDTKKLDRVRDLIDSDAEGRSKKSGSTLKMVLMVILAIAAGIGVAYLIYRYFRPDYLDSFNDDFDDDFDDYFSEDDQV